MTSRSRTVAETLTFRCSWDVSPEIKPKDAIELARPMLARQIELLGHTPLMDTAEFRYVPSGWSYEDPLGGDRVEARVSAEWGVWEYRTNITDGGLGYICWNGDVVEGTF